MTYTIAAVSYLNTIPFVYGLRNHEVSRSIQLQLLPPANCADVLFSGKVDIALVPIGALLNSYSYKRINSLGIAATGKVDSVFLFSQYPINEIKSIWLDKHSRTSILLAKLLAKNHWKINPAWKTISDDLEIDEKHDSIVAIGDKTFDLRKKFKHSFDLSQAWFEYCQLPFVFACWITLKEIDKEFLSQLNEALLFGVNHKEIAVQEACKQNVYNLDALYYIKHNIHYNLEEAELISIQKFLNEAKKI